MQTVLTIVSLMPDTPAPNQLPAQMPQPPTWAMSKPPGTQCQGKPKLGQGSHIQRFHSPISPARRGWHLLPHPNSGLGKGRGGGSSLTPSSLWPAVMGEGCSCGKLAGAASSSRESGKNDIKPGKMQAG